MKSGDTKRKGDAGRGREIKDGNELGMKKLK